MFASGGLAWRLRFFWCTVHGNRSAMLANVSPHKEEKISLVRQVCDDGGLWPAVSPADIQLSPFCTCRNVHTYIGTQLGIFCIQHMNSEACSLTWSLHKPLPFLFFFLLLHWVFSSECCQQSTQLSIPSSSLSSVQWWTFWSSPSEGKQKQTVRKQTKLHNTVCFQSP